MLKLKTYTLQYYYILIVLENNNDGMYLQPSFVSIDTVTREISNSINASGAVFALANFTFIDINRAIFGSVASRTIALVALLWRRTPAVIFTILLEANFTAICMVRMRVHVLLNQRKVIMENVVRRVHFRCCIEWK